MRGQARSASFAVKAATEQRHLMETMRIERLAKQRAADLATYRAAFAAVDVDGSGSVDPTEIVKFASSMGRRVDTARFWRLFNEVDINNDN